MEDYPGALLTGFWSLSLIYLFCICKTHTGICMQFNVNLRIFNVKMSATDSSPLLLLWEQQIWIHLTIGLVEKGFWVHKTIMCRVSWRNGLAWFSVKCDQGTFPWIRNNARTLWLNRMKTYQGVKRSSKPRTDRKKTKCILLFYGIDSKKPPLVTCTMVTQYILVLKCATG